MSNIEQLNPILFSINEKEAEFLCGSLTVEGVENIPGLTELSKTLRSSSPLINSHLMDPLQGLLLLALNSEETQVSSLLARGYAEQAAHTIKTESKRATLITEILNKMSSSGIPLRNRVLNPPQLTIEAWLGDL